MKKRKSMNILILVFLLRLSTGIKIDRDVSDTLHGLAHCLATGHAEGFNSCTCKPEYKTFMSSEGDEYTCKSLSEVGCEYSLQDNDQALLITEKNLVRPIFSGNITKNNLLMKNVLVWNYDGYYGSWNDITLETERLFKIDAISGKSNLHISKLTLKAMAGHAVKITFKDTKCLVFKFKGTVEYDFDLDEFKKKFEEKPTSVTTTANPPLSTTAAKPATTERKSTVEKVTSTSKPKIRTGIKIDRDESDTLHGFSHCLATGRAEGTFSCTCKPQYKTFMSSEGDEYTCKSLSEVGCEYSLQDNDQALLITEKNLVRPIFSGNITKNNLVIEKVLVWNYDGYHGSWNDITHETERLFKVDEMSGKSTLHISNLTLNAIAGHAVKITFKDTKCLVFKFKGTVEYGFDLDEFKKKFGVKPTSEPVTTTAAKPATTERKSTVEKVTSTSKPKITTSPVTEKKTTTIKPTTKRQMTKLPTTHPLTRPSTQTATKRMTTVSPSLQPRHKKHFKLSFKFETQLEIETED